MTWVHEEPEHQQPWYILCYWPCDGDSNHRRLGCLLNRLFRCRSKKISKLRANGLCVGNPLVTGGSLYKGPVTQKMIPLIHDVIINIKEGRSDRKTISQQWTYRGRVLHMRVSKLWPFNSKTFFWTNTGILLIGWLRTAFSNGIRPQQFSSKKIDFIISSAKWWSICLNVLSTWPIEQP